MEEFYDKLDILYSEGDRDAIEAFIVKAVKSSPDGSLERAGFLNELAGFYRGVSRFDESEEMFRKALAIFTDAGMELSVQYATVLLNLAGLYRMKGEAEKAVWLFHEAKSNIEDAGAEGSYEYISVLNNLALAYQETADYENALKYSIKALDLMRTGEASEHEIATSLNNIAATNISLGNLNDARTLIAESLAMYDAMPEPNVHHAAALTTKAVISCREGDYREALNGFNDALNLTRRFFGENVEYAVCKRNMSEVYELLGDMRSSVAELAEALRIFQKLLGADHPQTRSAREKLEQASLAHGNSFDATV